jgi:amidohydrolase
MRTLDSKDHILREASRIFPRMVKIRRTIHQYPELGFEEHRTARLVATTLRSVGLRVEENVAGTGVVGLLAGGRKGPVVAIRGDMDALPIQEQNTVAYRSRVKGKMHACGHDVHTSIVLGTAMVLSSIKDRLSGSVKFIFEPSEEKNPPGARELIKAGVLMNPRVDVVFGLHVFARAETGKLGFRPGPMMAAADEVHITIKGKGGHGALPHLTVDPVVVAAEVVVALQKIVSRFTNPFHPRVLTIGKIEGGTAQNVIPDQVQIAGTLRTMDESERKEAHAMIFRTVKGVTLSSGAKFELGIVEGAPVLYNDPKVTRFAMEAGRAYAGAKNVFIAEPVMGGESFGYFLQQIPGTLFRLGIANKRKGIIHDLHTPCFNVDEEAMKTGAGFLAYLAQQYLDPFLGPAGVS